jgi:hypothetical protein
MSDDRSGMKPYRRRPQAPHTGPRHSPRKADFPAFAIVFEDRVILRTPFNQEFIDAIKQIPAQLRAFIKEGRQLERKLREHLEENADYFSSHEELATTIEDLVNSIAKANGLSDSWAVALAVPELFDWAVGSALKAYPDLKLYDVRILADETPEEPS